MLTLIQRGAQWVQRDRQPSPRVGAGAAVLAL